MTKANRKILEKKKNILKRIYTYSKFKDIPKDVLNNIKFTYKVNEEFISRIFDEYKEGYLNL